MYEADKIEEMEKRIEHLEERVSILIEMADFEEHPFLYTALEFNLTDKQIKEINELMRKIQASLSSKTPMDAIQFKNELYVIVPSMNNNSNFANSIVSTLHKQHEYEVVYQHLKKDGMNI